MPFENPRDCSDQSPFSKRRQLDQVEPIHDGKVLSDDELMEMLVGQKLQHMVESLDDHLRCVGMSKNFGLFLTPSFSRFWVPRGIWPGLGPEQRMPCNLTLQRAAFNCRAAR